MALKVYARHGGAAAASQDDITARIPILDGVPGTPIVQMGMGVQNGGASQGTVLVPDPTANNDASLYFPPHTQITLTSDATGDELMLAQGRISGFSIGRAPGSEIDHAVEWTLTIDDANTDLRGLAFTEAWVRPAETGLARLIALAAYTLNGASSTRPDYLTKITYRPSTTIVVSATHLAPSSDAIVLPAKTYPAGTQPQDVANDVATTEGKVYGVVPHHVAGVSHLCLLYVKESDHSTYSSAVKISDQLADWDPDDLTAPVFEPIWDQGKGQTVDGNANISGLVSRYGTDDAVVISVDETLGDDNEYWVDAYQDGDSVDAYQATNRAASIIAYRSPFAETDSCSIEMWPEQHHLITAGMSIQVKAAVVAAGTTSTLGTYVDRRITSLIWEPRSNGKLHAILGLNRPTGRGGASAGQTQPRSTALQLCHGTESSCLDEFLRVSDDDWGISPIKCLTWQTHAGFLPSNEATDSSIVAGVAVQNSDGTFVHNDYLPLDGWDGTPPEFLVKTRFTEAVSFLIQKSGGFVGEGGIGIDAQLTNFRWDIVIDGSGNVDAGVRAVDSAGSTVQAGSPSPLATSATGVWLWARCAIDDHSIYLTVWKDGTSEPGSPNLQVTWTGGTEPHYLGATLGIQTCDLFQVLTADDVPGAPDGFAGTVEVKSIEITAGNDCGTIGFCDVCGMTGGPARTPGTSSGAAPIDHFHDSVDNGAAATGDLAGTYPAPTIPHITDSSDAHDASAISFTPNGSIAATDVQAAIQEVRDEAGGGSGPFIDNGGGQWKFDFGYSQLFDDDNIAQVTINGYIELFAETDADVLIEANASAAGGPAKIRLVGGAGVVIPVLTADPSGGDSEDGQLYYNSSTEKFRGYQNGAWVNVIGGHTHVYSEVPSGTVNGSNDTFTLAATPTSGTLRLYKNGLRQKAGAGNDYTLATATITFLTGNIPQTGDNLLADYE